MFNLLSITIFGFSLSSHKAKKTKKGIEAAQTMWQETLDLETVLPHEARIFTYQGLC